MLHPHTNPDDRLRLSIHAHVTSSRTSTADTRARRKPHRQSHTCPKLLLRERLLLLPASPDGTKNVWGPGGGALPHTDEKIVLTRPARAATPPPTLIIIVGIFMWPHAHHPHVQCRPRERARSPTPSARLGMRPPRGCLSMRIQHMRPPGGAHITVTSFWRPRAQPCPAARAWSRPRRSPLS